MAVIEITTGVKLYQAEGESVVFGCPPEVIKHFINQKIEFAQTIVLPDTNYKFGTLQNCTEFPLYYFLFVQGNFFKGKKLNIVGNKKQVEANRKLLRLTLLGLTKDEYDRLDDNPEYEQLQKEARTLALKDSNEKEYEIDDFINFIAFENNEAVVEGLTLRKLNTNKYEAGGEEIDINFNVPQEPPYDLRADFVPTMPSKFGVTVLGGASGFIGHKPCSGLVLNFNSEYMLIDCVPYLEHSLNARGISKQEIHSIFLSHVHDDHCNIFPFLEFSKKIKLIATKEIYYMALRKLSLQTGLPIKNFLHVFEFVELKTYQNNEFFGMDIYPHYTVHSIPTIGATFTMKHAHKEHRIVFVGDNKGFSDIENMVNNGLVPQSKYDHLKKLYTDRYDILFADGGGGILHGIPDDALSSQSDRIVFLHLENLPPEFDATFSMAQAGKRYTIDQGNFNSYMIKTFQILSDTFPKISHDWTTALMSNFQIKTFNIGDIIVKQGEASKGLIYIILSGSCSVMVHDGKVLSEKARKEAGDFVGEMAVLEATKTRNASIVARTPVTLCAIEENLFYEFLVQEKRVEQMRSLWRTRSELEKNFPFNNFSDNVNDQLSTSGTRLSIDVGEILIEQGAKSFQFFIILKGLFAVYHNEVKVNELGPGNVFGEYATLDQTIRNATVKCLEESIVLQFDNAKMEKLVNSIPTLNFYLRQLIQERAELLSAMEK